MLGRWFKKSDKLADADASVRLAALQQLIEDDAVEPEQLKQLAGNDPDDKVRALAIQQIQDPTTLLQLLATDHSRAMAALQLARHSQAAKDPGPLSEPLVVDAMLGIAGSGDIALLQPFLTTAQQVATLVVQLKGAGCDGLLSHPALRCEAGLQTLERESRNRDKAMNRLARNHLDTVKQARSSHEELASRIAEIDASLSKDATLLCDNDPDPAVDLVLLRAKMGKLLQQRSQLADEADSHLRQLAAVVEVEDVATIPAAPAIDLTVVARQNPFLDLTEELRAFAANQQPIDSAGLQAWASFQARWQQACDSQAPPAAMATEHAHIQSRYAQLQRAWQALQQEPWQSFAAPQIEHLSPQELDEWARQWQQHLHTLAWPSDEPKPAIVETVSTLQRTARERASEQQQALKQQQRQQAAQQQSDFDDAIQQVEQALSAGQYNAAVGAIKHARAVQKKLLQAGVKAADNDRQLSALSARLAEMNDWQKFATLPKRAELLAQLQTLAESPAAPPDQADQLRNLRAQWRQLGHPTSADERKQQSQFDALAEQAYEPCRAYFAEQESVRQDNLTQRQNLCNQLQQYLQTTDWSNADFKAAEQIMRTARQEWRKYHPCDRKALRPVEKNFEALQQQLHDLVKSAWDNNVSRKRQIIEDAKALLAAEDSGAQIEAAKQLQQQWRDVGATPRSIDQRLWKDFRAVCDQIFDQRSQAQAAYREQQQAAQQQLKQAITALEQATERAGQAGDASPKELAELTSAINERAGDLRIDRSTQQAITAAQGAYRKLLAEAKQAAARQALLQWQTWDEQVSAAEQNATTMEPPHAVFAGRLEAPGDTAAQPDQLLRLTLEAEIAADITSPEGDRDARMALQIELMNAGVRNVGNSLSADAHQELLHRWCALSKDAGADALRQRFFAAMLSLMPG